MTTLTVGGGGLAVDGTYRKLDKDDTDDARDKFEVGVNLGDEPRTGFGFVFIICSLASISISRLVVSTGLAAPNMDAGSACGARLESSVGIDRGNTSTLGRCFGSSGTRDVDDEFHLRRKHSFKKNSVTVQCRHWTRNIRMMTVRK